VRRQVRAPGLDDAPAVADDDVAHAGARRIAAIATPAAPAPLITTLTSARPLPTTRTALRSAARTTTAVPCWSSWNTGRSRRSCRRRSISKQRGALMSSRFTPPNVGASRATVSTISSGVRGVEADRHGVDAREVLEEHRLALHDRHRGAGADVAEAEHRGAVRDDGDRVAAAGVDVEEGGVRGDRARHLGHAGRVGERQLAAAAQRRPGHDLELAAEVEREYRVGGEGGVGDRGRDRGDVGGKLAGRCVGPRQRGGRKVLGQCLGRHGRQLSKIGWTRPWRAVRRRPTGIGRLDWRCGAAR
jgi:hypothetical protein